MPVAFSRNDPMRVRASQCLEEYTANEHTARWEPFGSATEQTQPPQQPSQGMGLGWTRSRARSQPGSRVLLPEGETRWVALVTAASPQGDTVVPLCQASGWLCAIYLLTREHQAGLQNRTDHKAPGIRTGTSSIPPLVAGDLSGALQPLVK